MVMKMKHKKKIVVVILILLIVVGGLLAWHFFTNKSKEEARKIKKVDNIDGYNYILEDRDNKVYIDEYKVLKKNLESNKIDYDEYAKSISKMFIIDLYTISNKVNKYDVGGTEFVHPDALENYELNVKDTIYKYVDDNSYGDRKQDLPEVISVKIVSFEKSTYTIDKEEIPSYEVSLNWTYKKDLEYDKDAKLVIVKKDTNLYIVEKTELKEESLDKK